MNPISEDMAQLLVQGGIGEFANPDMDWSIFTVEEPPNDPLRCVTLYETPGTETHFTNQRHSLFASGFQVRVRSFEHLEGWEKIIEIRDILNGKINFEVNGQGYGAILTDGGQPLPLPKDDKDRHIWVQSFVGHRKGGGDHG